MHDPFLLLSDTLSPSFVGQGIVFLEDRIQEAFIMGKAEKTLAKRASIPFVHHETQFARQEILEEQSSRELRMLQQQLLYRNARGGVPRFLKYPTNRVDLLEQRR